MTSAKVYIKFGRKLSQGHNNLHIHACTHTTTLLQINTIVNSAHTHTREKKLLSGALAREYESFMHA